jgi:hypothetical protein
MLQLSHNQFPYYPMSMRCATSSSTSTSPHSQDNDLPYGVNTPLSIGRMTAAQHQSWEAKEDHSTFEQHVIDMTLVIETLKILVFLTPRLEH